jgi:hypothetical protein
MTAYLLTLHFLNFIAPALFVALCVVLAARRWPGGRSAARSSRMGWGRQFAIVALVNVLVMVAGLVFFSQDGKLLTYAAMTLAAAIAQWLLMRAWRA